MKRFKIKTISFITIVLISLLLNPGIFLVNAKNDSTQEEIIILDRSKINVDDSKCFTIGDIDGDGTSEVITFTSSKMNSGVQWILNTYHKDNDIWYPVLSKIITQQISGHIHKVDIGNFDKDDAQEIIIASMEGVSSKIYILDFDWKQKEFNVKLIYELNTLITDLEVESSDSIYLLFSDTIEQFKTNVMVINPDKKGFSSRIIYSEPAIYWNLFTIGQFIEQESHEDQILLYRYGVSDSMTSPAVIRIINSDSEVLMVDTNIGEYSEIRDIIALDRKRTKVEELCMLETNNLGDELGFENKIIYCGFNHDGLLEKEVQLLDTNKVLNQLGYGKLDGNEEQLLILDPYAGLLDYLRAFDGWAQNYFAIVGYFMINYVFELFKAIYLQDLNILVSSKGNYYYTSSGSNSQELLYDLKSKTSSARLSYGADIVIGVSEHPIDDWLVLGRGYRPGEYCIIFQRDNPLDSKVIAHEVGHNYGLAYPNAHCSNFFCIMYNALHPLTADFCDTCEYYLDEDKFGAPPPPPPPPGGGGGCPFFSVFDGIDYIEEGLLDIHDTTGADKIFIHTLETSPHQVNNRIYLRLTEHPQTISDIDHVRLYGRLENGQWVSLHLKSAIHSAKGEVRKLLQFSDDLDVEELGADYNNGISESIDLEFDTGGETSFLEFRFIIEGNNVIIKP